MANVNELFDTVGGWLKSLIDLGLALALIFLVINVLFGVGPDIVANLADFIESFTDRGVVGLIVFLFILSIYQR